jgi:hypothetical protein
MVRHPAISFSYGRISNRGGDRAINGVVEGKERGARAVSKEMGKMGRKERGGVGVDDIYRYRYRREGVGRGRREHAEASPPRPRSTVSAESPCARMSVCMVASMSGGRQRDWGLRGRSGREATFLVREVTFLEEVR